MNGLRSCCVQVAPRMSAWHERRRAVAKLQLLKESVIVVQKFNYFRQNRTLIAKHNTKSYIILNILRG